MTSSLSAFFDHIHPDTGWLCLFTLPDRRHHWFDDTEAMAAAALRLDAEGKAVFHACASFTEKKRKQEHVAGIKCLWLDIDAGAGKPYATVEQAYSALAQFGRATSLPDPAVVASGGGLHAYWPLRDSLSAERWQSGARALLALAQQSGLDVDSGSTIDSARVLRPPGTHNRKLFDVAGKKIADVGGESREVRCGPLVGPYSIDELSPLFAKEVTPVDPNTPATTLLGTFSLGAVPAYLKGKTEELPNVDERDADPAAIVERCAQVRRLRETQGGLAEPEWYAVLGVLVHCGEQGVSTAHVLSQPDSRYTKADTDAKLAQYLRNASGPTTCARFAVLNPLGCIGCKYAGKVSSPIQLGRDVPAALAAPAPDALTLPVLPKPFGWYGMKLGVARKPKADDEDTSTHHIITDYPIYISTLQETEREKKVSAVFRSWEPMKHEWRDFSMDLGAILGMSGRGSLANHGVAIGKKRWDNFGEYVTVATNHYRGTQHYGTQYQQFGWKAGPSFVIGNDCLRRSGGVPERVYGSDEVARRAALMVVRGDVSAWIAAAQELIAPEGMEAHRFMLMCAFAAVLYHFTNEIGATFVHALTTDSGQGKTTFLNAGGSVFGEPEATSIIARDTPVAKFITLGVLNNLPVFFDELRFPTPEETKDYVLLGTLGRDKQRGKADGGIRSDQLPWSTIHISAANISLIDAVQHDGAETAQAARVFEFSLRLPAGLKVSDGDALVQRLRENRGTAGRAFVQHCLDHYDEIKAAVPARMRHYEEALHAGPESRFVIRLFACVDVACNLARQCGVLAVDKDSMMAWASSVQTGAAAQLAVDSKQDPISVVSEMMADLLPGTLVLSSPTKFPTRELIARHDPQAGEYLIRKTAVREWMQRKHYPVTEMGKRLHAAGIVTDLRTRRTLGAGMKLPGGQPWCWRINLNHPDIADVVSGLAGAGGTVIPFERKA